MLQGSSLDAWSSLTLNYYILNFSQLILDNMLNIFGVPFINLDIWTTQATDRLLLVGHMFDVLLKLKVFLPCVNLLIPKGL